jgi:protein-S-isoprenylcysteine O-methyltransferase Ste14
MNPINYWINFLVVKSTKKHNIASRTIATVLGATAFSAGIPALVFWGGKLLNNHPFLSQNVFLPASIVCFIIGLPLMLSAVFWQLKHGKGTPVPIVPTKIFLTNGPYKYVRNPMILGFSLYLLGLAFLFNKTGAFLSAATVIAIALVEVKIIEEAELEKRFGDAYRQYKKQTPFIFPKWNRKSEKKILP